MQVVILSVNNYCMKRAAPLMSFGLKYIAECNSDIETIVYYFP